MILGINHKPPYVQYHSVELNRECVTEHKALCPVTAPSIGVSNGIVDCLGPGSVGTDDEHGGGAAATTPMIVVHPNPTQGPSNHL